MAAAEIGALSDGGGDRWSDLDITFGVLDEVNLYAVLDDWTARLAAEYAAVHIFDLPSGSTIYRVFLFPGCLQVDLSFTPAVEFGPHEPFRLIFGNAINKPQPEAPISIEHLFGLGAHHAVRARTCIERGRLWQAEYWISAVRDQALTIACGKRGLPTSQGRGFDGLPPQVVEPVEAALVRSISRDGLLRALGGTLAILLAESGDIPAARKLKPSSLLWDPRSPFASAPPRNVCEVLASEKQAAQGRREGAYHGYVPDRERRDVQPFRRQKPHHVCGWGTRVVLGHPETRIASV